MRKFRWNDCCSYLLGLLAMIKCSICSYQCDNWYVSNWRLDCHIYFCLGRCFLELAQGPSRVAPELHFSGCSSPFGVTTMINTLHEMMQCIAYVLQKKNIASFQRCGNTVPFSYFFLARFSNPFEFASWQIPKQTPCYMRVGSFRSKDRATHNVKLCESGSKAKTVPLTMWNFASRAPKQKPCYSQC